MPQEFKVLTIIWAAMGVALTLFVGISATIPVAPPEPPEPALYGPVLLAAVGPAFLGLAGIPMFMKHLPANTAWIMRFASAESVGLFGLVLAFIGAPAPMWVGLFVVAFSLMIAVRPTAEAFTAWEMRRMGGDG